MVRRALTTWPASAIRPTRPRGGLSPGLVQPKAARAERLYGQAGGRSCGEGCGLPERLGSGSRRTARRVAAARVLSDRSRIRRAGGAQTHRRPHGVPDADIERRPEGHAACRIARVHAEGPALEADDLRGSGHAHSPVRGVQRSDQRQRNVPGRPLRRYRSQRHRHLRDRLQPRVQPVLLLQPHLRMSVPAPGEPLENPGASGRANEEV